MPYRLMSKINPYAQGFVNQKDNGPAYISINGLQPRVQYRLYEKNTDASEFATTEFYTDERGNAKIKQSEKRNEALIADLNDVPQLYIGDDMQTLLWLIKRKKAKQTAKTSAAPPAPKQESLQPALESAPQPEPQPSQIKQAVQDSNKSKTPQTTVKEKVKTREKNAYGLRCVTENRPVDALP